MQQIFIKNLNVFGHHGVYEEEQLHGQNFLINAVIDLRETRASDSDDLSDTLNYGEVCLMIGDYFANHRCQLLEKAGNDLSNLLLDTFPLIQELELEIGKPKAPIPMEFENVGIRTHKKWTRCYLSLGSNMGERSKLLAQAVKELEQTPGICHVRCSSMIETKPYGDVPQDDFMNMAVELDTYLTCHELLERIHEIEQQANRTREIHWGPRTLDLDIIFFGDSIISEPDLIVPHIDMANRLFVLQPLWELNPGIIHPLYHCSIQDLLFKLQHLQ